MSTEMMIIKLKNRYKKEIEEIKGLIEIVAVDNNDVFDIYYNDDGEIESFDLKLLRQDFRTINCSDKTYNCVNYHKLLKLEDDLFEKIEEELQVEDQKTFTELDENPFPEYLL